MTLPPSQCWRLFAGEPPLLVWREHLGLAQTDLRPEAGIRVQILDKPEPGVLQPTQAEARRLGKMLGVNHRDVELRAPPFGAVPLSTWTRTSSSRATI
jgi:hypothetical protein